MPRLLLAALLLTASLAACAREADRSQPALSTLTVDPLAPDTADVATADTVANDTTVYPLSPEADPAKARALDTALDTLDAFVQVLERVAGPINAWNQAAEAARLLRYLERNQAAFALDETDAARRYPQQVARLQRLEARRAAELERIGEDPVALRMLVQEMAAADAEAAGR